MNISHAQVITDGTAGEGVALEGPDYDIGAELGTQAGGNLFHSFEQFSIDTGESTTFGGPGGIDNIISRVTGGELSTIDGLIISTIPGASLWLFNPAGVVFGPNASLDVTGSFHVSTADELRTADGGTYSAIDPDASGFSVAEPQSFGFLGADPASITIAGSQLEVGEGETLSVVGGEVDIAGATLFTGGGELNVLTADGAADANVVTGDVTGAAGGIVAVREASSLRSTGDGGGRIRIQGGAFIVDDGSAVVSSNTGSTDGDVGIDVDAETIDITGNSLIATGANGDGDGGDVDLSAETLRITDSVNIGSNTIGEGNGGDINITGDRIALENSSAIASTQAGGDSGGINVFADDTLTLTDGNLLTAADVGSAGDGGDIRVTSDATAITAGGPGGSSRIGTASFSSGRVGNIEISGGQLLVDGENEFAGASIQTLANNEESREGQIKIAVGRLDILDGGTVLGESNGNDGNEAAVDITADEIRIDGSFDTLTGITLSSASDDATPSSIVVRAGDLSIQNGGLISTVTDTASGSSAIFIFADKLTLGNDDSAEVSTIISSSTPDATGDAGDITIISDSINISGEGSIFSTTQGVGRAGDIDIVAESQLDVRDNGRINSSSISENSGDAGSITIATEDLIVLDSSTIISATFGSADAGTIDITAGSVLLDRRNAELFGGITTQAARGSSGDAGSITLAADDLTILNDSQLSSSAFGSGSGGDIAITAGIISIESLQGTSSSLTGISTATEPDIENGTGDAGSIVIVADQLFLRGDDAEITSANDGFGSAGDIDIRLTEGLVLGNGADITTISASGDGGGITIRADGFVSATGPGALIATTVADDSGDAGNILIETPILGLGDASILARADAGRGGDIQVSVEDLILSPTAIINAEAGATGVDGTVSVSAPEVDLTGGIVAFDGRFLDIASLLRERCAARRASESSSFTLGTGGSIPADLDTPRLSFLQARPKGALLDQRTSLVLPCPNASS
ncbi:MAG: filamentous hemagglutinin N-terminal domain-containing protein [Pseudomonadota bacterium]